MSKVEGQPVKPPREVYVGRRGDQEELRAYFESSCVPLYGSDVRYDKDGNIFYPTWRQVPREEVIPESYELLSKKPVSQDVYLSQRLVTKLPIELRINRIEKDGGSVEVAIRAVEHVLINQMEKEQPQAKTVKGRVAELFELFTDPTSVSDEELARATRLTYKRLTQVGLDPQRVILEEKKLMSGWLIKASGGKDSLERRNPLIIAMALEAAGRRAVTRDLGVGEIVSKFTRMDEALRFERAFCRTILREVTEELAPTRMPAHVLFKYPERRASNVGIFRGKLNNLRWQLTQPHVKPYRPVGREVAGILDGIDQLLVAGMRREVNERELFVLARTKLEGVLIESHYLNIYQRDSAK